MKNLLMSLGSFISNQKLIIQYVNEDLEFHMNISTFELSVFISFINPLKKCKNEMRYHIKMQKHYLLVNELNTVVKFIQ